MNIHLYFLRLSLHFKTRCALSITLISFALSIFLSTNVNSQPFSKLDIGLGYNSAFLMNDPFSSRWDIENSISLSILTPFYIGKAGLGIDYFFYSSPDDQNIEYESYVYSFGLFFEQTIAKYFFITLGPYVGIQDLIADETIDNVQERELLYGIKIEPGFSIKQVSFFLSAETTRTFFYNRQDIVFFGGGIRYKLSLPESLQDIIR